MQPKYKMEFERTYNNKARYLIEKFEDGAYRPILRNLSKDSCLWYLSDSSRIEKEIAWLNFLRWTLPIIAIILLCLYFS